jgi:hypothetical protein
VPLRTTADVIDRFNHAFVHHATRFEPEEVVVADDRATIRWRYRHDADQKEPLA